jgi:hypothetical protein
MRALPFLLALAAACGDRQIVLELAGAAPGATHLDLVLLEPVVMAKEQRHNDPARLAEGTLETVFYMEERSRTPLDLHGAEANGFQLEVRDAGGPFVPLVAAWSGTRGASDEQLVALGVYAPDSIAAAPLDRAHVPAAVSPVSDVTIFQIDLEPVDRAFALDATVAIPQLVKPREVMRVSCGATGAISGVVWRRADGHELRVLAQIPTPSSGNGRLDPPDLDCDQHSPGRAQVQRTELGDQRDCDDTAFAVHGEARERCSALDEDCNSDTTLSPARCTQTCASTLQICACDDAARPEACLLPISGVRCKVASTSSGGTGRQPCESAGPLKLLDCAAGCEVLLAWAPEGLEVSISDDQGTTAYGLGKWAPLTDATAYLSIGADRALSDPNVDIIARVRVGALTKDIAIPLVLTDGACDPSPALFVCPQ